MAQKTQNIRDIALEVIAIELAAVQRLTRKIDDSFDRACHIMLTCQGKIVVTGMGKSGHIASKIAATLASTGTPAFLRASRRG